LTHTESVFIVLDRDKADQFIADACLSSFRSSRQSEMSVSDVDFSQAFHRRIVAMSWLHGLALEFDPPEQYFRNLFRHFGITIRNLLLLRQTFPPWTI